jgi:Fur family peroxide stress response transcriptional regulator
MKLTLIKIKLKEAGMKITPQRIAVLQALMDNRHHPTADDLIKTIWKVHSNISAGTVYHILNTLVSKKVIGKIETVDNVVRYDATTKKHYHLYLNDKHEIVDFFDDELDGIIMDYLINNNKLDNIDIEDVKIQIIGKARKPQTGTSKYDK